MMKTTWFSVRAGLPPGAEVPFYIAIPFQMKIFRYRVYYEIHQFCTLDRAFSGEGLFAVGSDLRRAFPRDWGQCLLPRVLRFGSSALPADQYNGLERKHLRTLVFELPLRLRWANRLPFGNPGKRILLHSMDRFHERDCKPPCHKRKFGPERQCGLHP